RYRAAVAVSAAMAMLKADPSSAGQRRVMLYVSNGYQLDPPDDRLAKFANTAQRARATVFALNGHALPAAPEVTVRAGPWEGYRLATWNSLRAISDPTGGFAVLHEADLADALARISRTVR